MPYATQKDLEDLYGTKLIVTLSDTDGDGKVNPATIEDALDSASSIIDAYLAARYQVPIENAPRVVRDLCVDIALYRMALSRLKQTAEMRLRYEDAIKLLQLVATGKASIGLDTDDDALSDDQSAQMVARTSFLKRA